MASQGEVRIIAGQFRGRKIKVPDLPGLRPTPDRVRETVFNWLAPVIAGAKCLDLFAGSGALGFEALSRGASEVVMVDASRIVTTALRQQLAKLEVKQATVYEAHIPEQWPFPPRPFDIIFLDPPFQEAILLPTCFSLEENGFLADNAYIYLESGAEVTQQDLPASWELIKAKKAGQVWYHLAQRNNLKK